MYALQEVNNRKQLGPSARRYDPFMYNSDKVTYFRRVICELMQAANILQLTIVLFRFHSIFLTPRHTFA